MEKRQKRISGMMLIATFLISGTIFLQMVLYVIAMTTGCASLKFHNLVEVCHVTLKAIGLSSFEYLLDTLVVFTLLFALWKLGSEMVRYFTLKIKFRLYQNSALTKELNKKYGAKKESIIVISYPVPLAITMGFLSPKVIISTGLMNLLNDDELDAVIYHEMHHQKNFDPLKIFLLSFCASSFFYIPILKWFSSQYRIIQELLADNLAIEKQATSMNIGSALLKMLKVGKADATPLVYVSFADTSINYRIEYMLNPLKDFKLKIPVDIAFKSVMIFSLICIVFIYVLA
ncbi:M56 family metallopeptidase [Rummeliibacillus suwonensis]|uniref:M56 family metallopeptidase n=1 Tax=Rummeliibacillus suwonensis TaxID=1306154 RepID=UPI0011B55773|nr:M56 family metallopeptidase [Rummeliibacillus suwonensis]